MIVSYHITSTTALLHCQTWNLGVASGKRIMLTFESFDIEADKSCSYDYVQVLFGSYEQKYCGSNKPSPIISSDNMMTVVFSTDGSVVGSGFKATWKAVEPPSSCMLFGLTYLLWSDRYWGIHYYDYYYYYYYRLL